MEEELVFTAGWILLLSIVVFKKKRRTPRLRRIVLLAVTLQSGILMFGDKTMSNE